MRTLLNILMHSFYHLVRKAKYGEEVAFQYSSPVFIFNSQDEMRGITSVYEDDDDDSVGKGRESRQRDRQTDRSCAATGVLHSLLDRRGGTILFLVPFSSPLRNVLAVLDEGGRSSCWSSPGVFLFVESSPAAAAPFDLVATCEDINWNVFSDGYREGHTMTMRCSS